jgi:hypothetical protein
MSFFPSKHTPPTVQQTQISFRAKAKSAKTGDHLVRQCQKIIVDVKAGQGDGVILQVVVHRIVRSRVPCQHKKIPLTLRDWLWNQSPIPIRTSDTDIAEWQGVMEKRTRRGGYRPDPQFLMTYWRERGVGRAAEYSQEPPTVINNTGVQPGTNVTLTHSPCETENHHLREDFAISEPSRSGIPAIQPSRRTHPVGELRFKNSQSVDRRERELTAEVVVSSPCCVSSGRV